jgi:hypothetical protein
VRGEGLEDAAGATDRRPQRFTDDGIAHDVAPRGVGCAER